MFIQPIQTMLAVNRFRLSENTFLTFSRIFQLFELVDNYVGQLNTVNDLCHVMGGA